MNLAKNNKYHNNQDFEMKNAESDFQKLMDICNSYGLNQQETNQLIDQFKKGALFSPNKSMNDSLNESFGDLTFSQRQEEEYSFKNGKQQIQPKTFQKYKAKESQIKIEQSCNRSNNLSIRQQKQVPFQSLERLLMEKFSIQKHLVENLQLENENLKRSLCEKESQISNFMAMKNQDTQIIKALKDIIVNLSTTLKQKEISSKEIHDKYTTLMENRVRQLTSKRFTTEMNEQDNILQESTNLASSFSRTNSTTKLKTTGRLNESREQQNRSFKNLGESRQQQLKQSKADAIYNQMKKNRVSNRVDVKKYKEMIENLRSNY